jgi:hypothetical protein
MKTKLLLMFILTQTDVPAQIDKTVVEYLNKNFKTTSLHYLIFFEPELIEFSQDSNNWNDVIKEIKRQRQNLSTDSESARKERRVFLTLLRNRINKTKVITPAQSERKKLLLEQLQQFKVEFTVDEKLLEDRFNPMNRGLPYGDEECDIEYSLYTFFIYDPMLYVKTMKDNKIANPSGKIRFPRACFLGELSYVPMAMKKRVQQELLLILNKYKGAEYDIFRNRIKKADLSATYD